MEFDHELTPVREAHRFDEGALARYLSDRLAGCGTDMAVRQFEGGQSNPTFLLETAGDAYVNDGEGGRNPKAISKSRV